MKKLMFVFLIASSAVAEAVSFQEARELYQTCFTNPPPSLVSGGDYLFHIFDSYPGLNEDETIMRDQHRALTSYIGKSNTLKSPFSPSVTDKILPLVEFKMPSFQAFTVERTYHGNNVRVVTAFDAAPIEAARVAATENLPVRRTLEDWAGAVKARLLSIEDDTEQQQFLSQLGSIRRALSNMPTGKTIGENVDFLYLRSVEQDWKGGSATREQCRKMLSVNPTFAPAWRRLAELETECGDLQAALAADLLAGMVNPSVDRIMSRTKALDEASQTSTWSEFGRLYALLQESDLDFGGKAPFWRAVIGSAGRLSFSAPKVISNDKGAFSRAKALFKPYKGKNVQKDLEEAKKLLILSIEANPADAEKWRYYAAALRASKKPREAALAYLQTLSLNPHDQVAASDLIAMYEALGLTKLAEGDSWWMVMMGQSENPAVRKVIEGLRRRYEGILAD